MNPLRRSLADEPLPGPWREVFGRDAPIEVDVGFGRGHFLLERARQAPHANLVGIEMRRKWVDGLAARIARERVPNARVLYGEAARVIGASFAPGEVARFYVFFPDPWWKRRHHKRRLFTPELAALLADRLASGGEIFFQTDVAQYAERARALLAATAGLSDAGAWDPGLPPSPRERRYLRDGVPYQRMRFVKA
jgi:tRNA (guanine-N7-)-methyltransferase